MIMKAFGFQRTAECDRGDSEATDQPLELTEVSLVADSAMLRRVASFLNRCADMMDQPGAAFGHEHLKDALPDWRQEDSDLIIVKNHP